MAYQHPEVGRAKAQAMLSKTGHRAPDGMQKGGKMNADFVQDKRTVDSQLRKAFNQHNQEMHGGKQERLRLADGGMALGGMPMMRGDRAPRGKPKKSGNNVNVIIAGKGAGDAPPSVGPHPPVPPAMGMAGPPPGPPMPPPGPPPGGPPGGPPGMPPGGIGGAPPGLMGGPKPPMPGPGMPPMPGGPPGMPPPRPGMPPGMMRKSGGRINPKIAAEAKEEGESYKEEAAEMRKGLATGGKAPNMTAGAGSGAGRLELSKKISY